MMRKSKIISLLMAMVLLVCLCLTGCGQSKEQAGSQDAGAEQETVSEEAETLEDESQEAAQGSGEEYTEPLQDGHNQVTFYWNYDGSYDTCDIWIWFPGKDGRGYKFHECDYGGKVIVNVPEGVEEVGFIVRKDCTEPGGTSWGGATKDFDQDRFAKVEGRETFIYLQSGDPEQYSSSDGGKTLNMAKKMKTANMVDINQIEYQLNPKLTITEVSQVKVYEDDKEVTIANISTLGTEAASGIIEIEGELNLSANYRISIEGYGEKQVLPIGIFDSEYFAENFHYEGSDLGAVINDGSTTFKVWAPTASKVLLNLFEAGDGGEAYKTVDMVLGDKGVWSHTEDCGHGTYYTYTVTTAMGTQEAVDPYAKAAGVNGNRGMVVDLDKTHPENWDTDKLENPINHYSEAIIWEVHVRDFSNKIADSAYPGKYLAFTETGLVNEHGESVGVDYLKELGVTHVHLLPVYDYATVDEADPNADFNWGYDPKNYNVPEGSYSTDPFNGEVRILEYKQMVQALHEAGIGVIMDMVYNHTYDGNSSFNKIVPYYYYRYSADGANTSASGCGNDTASERYMFGKFIVESTSYWVDEYHLDGLRFDLMGLHDVQTMQEMETAVHEKNPNAILYGEGWTMGATIDGSAQANQANISQIKPSGDGIGAVAVFNDVIRDGLKGSVFEKTDQGYINGKPAAATKDIIFSLNGGKGIGQTWTVENAMVVNYMSAHDNNTLWDKLLLSNPDDTDDERNRMNNFGAAIVMISKGTPFWQAGEEMLRTKGGDENSYKSDDSVNNIDWSVLQEGRREYTTMQYYKGLIEMRKSFDIFTNPDTVIATEELGSGLLAVTYDDGKGGQVLAILNPHNTALPYVLDGQWNLVATASEAGSSVLAQETGSVNVDSIGVRIYVNDALVK